MFGRTKASCELQTTTILGSPSSSFRCSSWRGIHFPVDFSGPVKCRWSERSANIGSPTAPMPPPCRCSLHPQVSVSTVSPVDVALLFERAFSRQGSQPNGRPRPDEWVTALQDLEQHLKKCAVNPAHQFVDTLSKCPWCEIEAATGVPLFQVALIGSGQTGFTIAALWAKVNSVPKPGPPPALPSIGVRRSRCPQRRWNSNRPRLGAKIASGFFALIGRTSRHSRP